MARNSDACTTGLRGFDRALRAELANFAWKHRQSASRRTVVIQLTFTFGGLPFSGAQHCR